MYSALIIIKPLGQKLFFLVQRKKKKKKNPAGFAEVPYKEIWNGYQKTWQFLWVYPSSQSSSIEHSGTGCYEVSDSESWGLFLLSQLHLLFTNLDFYFLWIFVCQRLFKTLYFQIINGEFPLLPCSIFFFPHFLGQILFLQL